MSVLAPYLPWVAWSFVPPLATRFALDALYRTSLLSRPPPGAQDLAAKHASRTNAALVLAYLLWSFYTSLAATEPSAYALLGLDLDASPEAVRKAFRKLAVLHHPDKVGPRGEHFFMALRTSHDVLTDSVKRFAYDRFGAPVLTWKNAVSYRDHIVIGLRQTCAFYIVNPLILACVALFNRSSNKVPLLSFPHLSLLMALAAIELYLITSPTRPQLLCTLLPRHTVREVVLFLHHLYTTSIMAAPQLIPFFTPPPDLHRSPTSLDEANQFIDVTAQRLDAVAAGATALSKIAERSATKCLEPFNAPSGIANGDSSAEVAKRDSAALTVESAGVPLPQPSPSSLPMTLPEYERYGRQMILPSFGLQGQLKLRNARVLVVGCGGLGCPAIQYLASAGVGHVTVVDHDVVERSNLARQILHNEERIGVKKAQSIKSAVELLNPHVTVNAVTDAFTPTNALALVRDHDLVLDCTDAPLVRYLVNDAAVLAGKMVVSGAAQGVEGQLIVLNSDAAQLSKAMSARVQKLVSSGTAADAEDASPNADLPSSNGSAGATPARGPCYRCLFPKAPAPSDVQNCEDSGVFGPITGIVGTLQAMEAIRLLVGTSIGSSSGSASAAEEEARPHSMLLCSPLSSSSPFRNIRIRNRRKDCRVCGEPSADADAAGAARITDLEKEDYVAFCGLASVNGQGNASERRIQVRELAALLGESTLAVKREEEATTTRSSTQYPAGMTLVDVRSPEEFSIAHLPSAINVPLEEIRRAPREAARRLVPALEPEPALASLTEGDARPAPPPIQRPRTQTLVCICKKGNDSLLAAGLLRRAAADAEENGIEKPDLPSGSGDGEPSPASTAPGSGDAVNGQSVTGEAEEKTGTTARGHGADVEVQVQVLDVEGGLRAWSREVDAEFPLY